MQTLNAPPRDGLTTAQVTAALQADAVTFDFGLELLDAGLNVVDDISEDFAGGKVKRVMNAIIHGTCDLQISRALAWGTVLVRPYMLVTGAGATARFNVGVYCLTTPDQVVGLTPATFAVQGADRLYLLTRTVGDTYVVAAGTGYLAAVQGAITAAGLSGVLLDSSAAAAVLPADRVWPLIPSQGNPSTWLNIVNDLLGDINYRGMWADENGLFRSAPYVDPTVRGREFTFDTSDPRTLVGEQRTLTQDIWQTPNKWIFVQSNRATGAAAPSEGDGVYTVTNNADGPTSVVARGLTWPKQVALTAADQSSLVAQGDSIVAADKRTSSTVAATTAPFPAAGHYDVFAYVDAELGALWKVQASQWQLDLTGADMSWTWERVA